MYLSKDDIIRIAKEADDFRGLWNEQRHIGDIQDFLCRFAKLVAEAEREACAKSCEELTKWHSKTVIAALDSAAENIRARSLDVHN